MQAVNDYVIVDKIKEEPQKVGGLLLTDDTDSDNRYKKASVLSVGNDVPIVKKDDVVYYDKHAGHDIGYEDKLYRVIRSRDIVIVE